MKYYLFSIFFGSLLLTACTPATVPTPESGTNIPVWSTSDSGDGSLRKALEDAQPYDTISFETDVFKPDAPATIYVVNEELPHINQINHLTLDASDAGVILDGSQVQGPWVAGLQIVMADGVAIRGLQISNFSGPGIAISGESRNNVIGGDRHIGAGPVGQGNMLTNNGMGISLAGTGTTLNTITGNLIGTDSIYALGSLGMGAGNLDNGITISEGAHDNLISQDNLIAYNGGCGVAIQGFDASGNLLTRNSIYKNVGSGICLVEGGNAWIRAPYLLSVDLANGLVSGSGCANCTIQIYSTQDGEEGQYFEGQVVADASGAYTFNNASFRFDNITANATDANGNTSEFSRPAGHFDSYDVVIQEANPYPRLLLLPWPSSLLEPDTRLGTGLYSSNMANDVPNLGFLINDITGLGVKRLDTSLNENEPPINWDFSEDDIPPEFDRFIDDLNDNGIAVNYLLHFWDKEGHAHGEVLKTPRFQSKEGIEEFLDYVRFIVNHFEGRIQYYTIWTEPDYCGDGQIKCIETADYINLVENTIPVIKAEDPQAKVGFAPYVLYFAQTDVFTILRSDVIKQFDAIQWHGIYDVTPDNQFYGNYYYKYPGIIERMKQTASANGFEGEYWGTELTWHTMKSQLVAKYSARAFVMQLGMDVGVGWPTFGDITQGWLWPTLRNLNTIMTGTSPASLAVEIDSLVKNHSYEPDGTWDPPVSEGVDIATASKIASYGFTKPNGDRLFALWTDGTAAENDPGVNSCLIFRGVAAEKVVALDALYGFEQELVTEKTNGNITICNLLVRDYPLLIRLSPAAP